MNRRWIEPAPVPDTVRTALARAFDLPFPVAEVLARRGHDTPEKAEAFLRPRLSRLGDPFNLPGMEAAVARTWTAIEDGVPILVFGDYDVDGICSTALMVSVLSGLGATVFPFVPNRISDGYGFTSAALELCTRTHRPGLIITVDCGINAVEPVAEAAAMGIDVIVTDHHEPGGRVARAAAVVNPKLGSDESVWHLAGVGVAFKFCHALLKEGRERGHAGAAGFDLKSCLDLVALGTVADIVPLHGENRTLARYGLECLGRAARPGLRMLAEVAGIRPPFEAYHVGYQFGPRLNAAGRMGFADRALELLLSEEADHALGLARELDGANRARQEIEDRMVGEALEDLEAVFDPASAFGLVVGRPGWHVGVLGIVASRMVHRFGRPAVVIGIGEEGRGRGSCRSIEGFDLVRGLSACGEHLLRHGGHAMAAGLEIETSCIAAFRERFNAEAASVLRDRDLRPSLPIDAWVDLDDVDARFFSSLGPFRPFGHGNPSPVWAASGVRAIRPAVVGRGHLRMTLCGGAREHPAIAFGMGDRPLPDGPIDVAFRLRLNRYQGRETLQLDVQDLRETMNDER